jgi:hypothetical protein
VTSTAPEAAAGPATEAAGSVSVTRSSSPAATPEVMISRLVPLRPTVTGVLVALPFLISSTVSPLTASVGTVTPDWESITTAAVAVMPDFTFELVWSMVIVAS